KMRAQKPGSSGYQYTRFQVHVSVTPAACAGMAALRVGARDPLRVLLVGAMPRQRVGDRRILPAQQAMAPQVSGEGLVAATIRKSRTGRPISLQADGDHPCGPRKALPPMWLCSPVSCTLPAPHCPLSLLTSPDCTSLQSVPTVT